jgi:hypothetical protein
MAGPDAQRLRAAAQALPPEGIEVAQLLAQVPGQQLGWLMLLCALPSALPGLQLGWVCGPLLMVLAWAQWQGRAEAQLPARLARHRVSHQTAHKLLSALAWTTQRLERWCRHCWPQLANVMAGRPAAAMVGCMALLILLPLPGSNFVPSLAIAALVAGLVWHDGRAIVLACLLALAGTGIVLAVGWGMATLAQGWI